MTTTRTLFAAMLGAALCLFASACGPEKASEDLAPHVVTRDGRSALMVDGAPFLMLAAQANNSSNYPATLDEVWPAIAQMHANTLEIPVAWEQVEPQEGQFDFSYVDTLIEQARAHEVRLVLLWFGAYKNTGPNYAPAWVKLNNARFPRMLRADGTIHYALSPHSEETVKADSKAFATLMRHLRALDGARHTVIMMQVENETGSYGNVRDHAPATEALFQGQVPAELTTALGKPAGTWGDVFGADADVSFQAWHIARYVEAVAAAGKAEYDLPMYSNAALRDPVNNQDPMTYAAGGPTWNVLDIWKVAAPSLFTLAPDIYDRPSAAVSAHIARYDRPDNPLLVVEIGNAPQFAGRLFEVLGHHGIGFAPFGMDFTGYSNYPLGTPAEGEERLAPFTTLFEVLAPAARDWARISFEHPVWGVSKPDDNSEQTLELGRWRAKVEYDEWAFGRSEWTFFGSIQPGPNLAKVSGGALIAELGPDEYLVFAQNARVSFDYASDAHVNGTLFDYVQEGHFENGQWVMDRIWNGDQTDYGLNFSDQPRLLKVKLATY